MKVCFFEGGLGDQLTALAAFISAAPSRRMGAVEMYSFITSSKFGRITRNQSATIQDLEHGGLLSRPRELFARYPLAMTRLLRWLIVRLVLTRKLVWARWCGTRVRIITSSQMSLGPEAWQILRESGMPSRLSPRNPSSEFVRLESHVIRVGAVGVHVRLGDFRNYRSGTEILSPDHYEWGLNRIREDYPLAPVFVFSDEPRAAALMLGDFAGLISVATLGLTVEEEFSLFSACQSKVLSRSAFSWWAAAFSPRKSKVVVPLGMNKFANWVPCGCADCLTRVRVDWP